jgi:hypothetical protein
MFLNNPLYVNLHVEVSKNKFNSLVTGSNASLIGRGVINMHAVHFPDTF